jgi:F-type H+-transporting ATPase subunit b
MESLLDIKPGLLIWTLINFALFLLILIKFGSKPISEALKAREHKIEDSIAQAVKANSDAQEALAQVKLQMENARSEVAEIITKGKKQAEEIIHKASEESNKIKKQKLDEALKEIESSKNAALFQLRSEVADMVVNATEKILDEKLDKEKDYKLIDSFIQKLPNN